MPTESQPVLSVTQVTAHIKAVLEEVFESVWVGGEISNLSQPRSGHIYFTLKDEGAQLRAAIWRSTAERLRFDLKDGMQVVCRGDIEVYPPRGSYQLIVRKVEPQGEGALQQALRKLQQKLADEGLFDPANKQPLPRFPRRIGVVTSPTGAAVRDFLEVVRRRWQGVHVLILPARGQGEGAAREIIAAIRRANQLKPPLDLLVVTRGGGSLEDLWCFNEEAVVRAISASRLPVVSAVGHEIDVTLSDLVADMRALTPTEAAERVVPSREDVESSLASLQARLTNSLKSSLAAARARVESLAQRRVLRRPLDQLHDLSRRLEGLESRAERAVKRQLGRTDENLASLSSRLEALSPLGVLARGYSVTFHGDQAEPITDVADLSVGDPLTTRFLHGTAISRVEEIESRQTPRSRDDRQV